MVYLRIRCGIHIMPIMYIAHEQVRTVLRHEWDPCRTGCNSAEMSPAGCQRQECCAASMPLLLLYLLSRASSGNYVFDPCQSAAALRFCSLGSQPCRKYWKQPSVIRSLVWPAAVDWLACFRMASYICFATCVWASDASINCSPLYRNCCLHYQASVSRCSWHCCRSG